MTAIEWNALAADPEFIRLLRARRAFVVPCTIFALAFYLGLPIGVAVAPRSMSAPMSGGLSVAFAYGLLQFVMAWVLLAAYMQAAKRFDERAREIAQRLTASRA